MLIKKLSVDLDVLFSNFRKRKTENLLSWTEVAELAGSCGIVEDEVH